jgi:hypothetical protein
MKKNITITKIFKDGANEIIKCRENCIHIHGNDIRAAGNEVEICIRDYFRQMLPSRYHVISGHLIDENENISSQLDLIISDNNNLPSLFTTRDGTSYIPIESTYAIGEIKSTYYKSEKYIENFIKVIKSIKQNLSHEEVINTAYMEIPVKSHTQSGLIRTVKREKKLAKNILH